MKKTLTFFLFLIIGALAIGQELGQTMGTYDTHLEYHAIGQRDPAYDLSRQTESVDPYLAWVNTLSFVTTPIMMGMQGKFVYVPDVAPRFVFPFEIKVWFGVRIRSFYVAAELTNNAVFDLNNSTVDNEQFFTGTAVVVKAGFNSTFIIGEPFRD